MTMQRTTLRRAMALAAVALCGGSAAAQISFGVPIAYGTGSDPEAVIAADFDGDSDLELLSTIHSPSRLSLLDNLGNGTFAAPVFTLFAPGVDPAGLAASDVDLDGDMDVLVSSRETGEVLYLVNDGTGQFTSGMSYAVGARPNEIVAFDFDMDGDEDVAVSNRDGASVTFLRNVGAGKFELVNEAWVGDSPRGMAIGRFDGDLLPDLVVAVHDASKLTVLHLDDSGQFSKYLEVSVGTDDNPESVGVGDFDGDGDDDIVASRSSPTTNEIVLFLRVGIGTIPEFAAPQSLDTGGVHPKGVLVHDLDLDRWPDVVTVNARSNTVAAFRNLGGVLQPPTLHAVLGPGSDYVTCGDLDLNHYVDLVCTNDGGNSVSVLINARTNPGSYCIAAPNSVGHGAYMSSSGSHSLSTNDMVLHTSGLPPFMNGLYFYGSTPIETPFQSGYLCMAAPVIRLGPQAFINGLGEASRNLDFSEVPFSSGSGALTAGSVWNFQMWYRDPNFGAGTTNMSDGWRVVFEP